ncbi:MAG: hypothetical protein KGQ41_04420 [Alphaproteobacteria bacterium]|nr:hypothetical protein [Alphaproteobacteria bacterium]
MKRRITGTLVSGFLALAASGTEAYGQACPTPDNTIRFDQSMAGVGRLMLGQELRIVALGSSSTEGAGADKGQSYPERLEAELRARFPRQGITVVNSGVGGEDVDGMMLRLERDVFAHNPHMVLFQVGTNVVLQGRSVAEAEVKIAEAIRAIQSRGIEVVLMNAQFAPAVEAKPDAPKMMRVLDEASRAFRLNLIDRHALMRGWHRKNGIPVSHFTAADNLHMNAWSYDCLAKAIASAFSDSVNRAYARLLP